MKLKKKYAIILIITLIILITIVFILIFNTKEIKYNKVFIISLNDKVPKEITYNEDKKASISWDKIDVNKIGTYNGTFKVKNKEYEVILKVMDTKPPVINGVHDIEVKVNEEINLLENITVTDDSKEIITPLIKGDYDLSKIGTYNLSYEATDKSGNKTVENFTLKVMQNDTPVIPLAKPNIPSSDDTYTLGTSSKGYEIKVINGVTYVNNILIANKTYGLPSDYAPGFSDEANHAYDLLRRQANEDNMNIFTLNSYRSYIDQKIIYNDYVQRDGQENADTYSARPGYSEHQSGLAIDVNSLDQDWENTPEGKWLSANCWKFGFIIRYPKGKENITGYMYEPWHIRYVGTELSQILYNNGDWITLEEYLGITSAYTD